MGVAAGDRKAAAPCRGVPEDHVLSAANGLLLCCSSGEKSSVSSDVVLEFCTACGLQLLLPKPAPSQTINGLDYFFLGNISVLCLSVPSDTSLSISFFIL